MLKKIQDYFIGEQLRRTDDVFEHARIIMIYRFSWVFFFLFSIPVTLDVVLHYDKLLIVHLVDFVSIFTFPFLLRYIRSSKVQVLIFFLLCSLSSCVVFLMVNPENLELVGVAWIIFFTGLSTLLQRGALRIIFSCFILWLPVLFVFINSRMGNTLTIHSIVQENAVNPPEGMMFVPIFLLIYAIWSHTSTIDQARRTITAQKNEIENKNKDITDSINYARHLQDALLPDEKIIRDHFPRTEILYRPKAIVAGDFYWTEKAGSKVFIAAADCTGHGVPGAMVSVVCSGALTRAVREFGLTDTGAILDKTRDLVIETFDKHQGGVNDGMDISLLCIDRSNGAISWSGANNPVWVVDENGINIIKPDKQPIGHSSHASSFTTQRIAAKQGDAIYLFTDGLADQFGGPDGKKLRYKPIQEFLQKNHTLPTRERINKLDELFLKWKGNLEQVDDICMLSVTV